MSKKYIAYLAEGVPALRYKGVIQLAHADGALIFLKDVVDRNLDLLGSRGTLLFLQYRFYHLDILIK